MIKLNNRAKTTILAQALLNNAPVKLEICGHWDNYFCKVQHVDNLSVLVEYHNYTDLVEFSDLTNIIS